MGDSQPSNAKPPDDKSPHDNPAEQAQPQQKSEPPKPSEWWQRRGNYSQMVSAAFAVLALCAAIVGFTIASNQLHEVRVASAKRLWGDYLRLAVEKPDLAAGDYDKIKADNKFVAYQAFVWNLLYACDEIALTEFPDEGWRSACRVAMRRHVRFLCESEIEGIDAYAKETQELMTEVMLEAKRKGESPECAAVTVPQDRPKGPARRLP